MRKLDTMLHIALKMQMKCIISDDDQVVEARVRVVEEKKISYHSRRGWICGDVNSWLTASTWSPQAWLTLSYFFISLCLLRTFVAWWPETPPPLRTPQSPADGRPGSRSLSRAVASSMKLYRTCHLRKLMKVTARYKSEFGPVWV